MYELQPTAADMISAMGLLVSENEQLRANQNNASPIYGRRDFTREDLERGRQLAPQVFVTHDGHLVVKLDS
jgi:hypothetical protein